VLVHDLLGVPEGYGRVTYTTVTWLVTWRS
jgi:hypothetical protein